MPDASVVEILVETLCHRHIGVVGEEFAVSSDAMEMFGVLDLEAGFEGCRFAIGIRNANNKRFRLACTVGLPVFVCHNLAFRGNYTPVLANTRSISRSKSGMSRLTIYRAFIEGEFEVPKHLARRVHDLYFNPQHEEFAPRTIWSRSPQITTA